MRRPNLSVILVVLGVWTGCLSAPDLSMVYGQWQDSIDYTKLVNQLGTVEDGTGIPLSMGEVDVNGDPALFTYMPNVGHAGLAGKNIVDGSGLNNSGSSTHATGQARRIFGDLSIAQGAVDMTVYDANDYLNRVLGFATGGDPLAQPFKVQSHAWIAGGAPTATAENLLQRLDYLVNQNDISIQVGLNNGSGNSQPQLLGQAYNVLSVGRTDGNHSRGFTTLYGAGRLMPDVVMDANSTSRATSQTSSVMAVLHQKAVNEGNADASRSVMMKSIVMAGATKNEFPGWSRTTTQPLDSVFGAGEVNIYNSYFILQAGETDGSSTVPAGATIGRRGWDYGESITSGSPLYYNFEVDPGLVMEEVTINLSWNIDVTDSDPGPFFDPLTSLADMSLRLYDSTGAPLEFLIDESVSPVDNVEHIYFQDLVAGLYTIQVSTNQLTDYGLAWTMVVPEPNASVALLFGTLLYGAGRRRRRSRG